MTREELEARLDERVKAGLMTSEEADLEWLEFIHRDEVWDEW